MLLTAGERISMALLAMAIANLGHEARSFTGSQAGVITDSAHGKAKIIDVTPGRIEKALEEGAIAIVAGFQGVSQDTKDITTLGRGGSDTTAVALAAALDADVCEIYTDVDGVFTADPRIVPTARKRDRRLLRGDARDGGLRREDPAPAVRRVRPPLPDARSTCGPRSARSRAPGSCPKQRRTRWSRRSSPASPTTAARPRSPSSACPDKVGEAARIFEALADGADQPRHDRAERLGGGDQPHRHLVHAAARATARRRWRRWPGIKDEVGYDSLLYDDQIGKVSLIGAGMRSHPGVTAKFFAALAAPA